MKAKLIRFARSAWLSVKEGMLILSVALLFTMSNHARLQGEELVQFLLFLVGALALGAVADMRAERARAEATFKALAIFTNGNDSNITITHMVHRTEAVLPAEGNT